MRKNEPVFLTCVVYLSLATIVVDVQDYDPNGILRVLFGDLTIPESYFLNEHDHYPHANTPPPRQRPFTPQRENARDTIHPFDDVRDFHAISEVVENATRRRATINTAYIPKYANNFFGLWQTDWGDWKALPKVTEPMKVEKLIQINLTFLQHSRYNIEKVLRWVEPVRRERAYKMGYLLAKLRRMHSQQLQLANGARAWHTFNYSMVVNWKGLYDKYEPRQNVLLLLQIYEKVVRLDIDISDLIDHIKTVAYSNETLLELMVTTPKVFPTRRRTYTTTPPLNPDE